MKLRRKKLRKMYQILIGICSKAKLLRLLWMMPMQYAEEATSKGDTIVCETFSSSFDLSMASVAVSSRIFPGISTLTKDKFLDSFIRFEFSYAISNLLSLTNSRILKYFLLVGADMLNGPAQSCSNTNADMLS